MGRNRIQDNHTPHHGYHATLTPPLRIELKLKTIYHNDIYIYVPQLLLISGEIGENKHDSTQSNANSCTIYITLVGEKENVLTLT